MITADQIQKYSKKSLSELIGLASKHFNSFIRKRDEEQKCISCDSWKELQAGHYYSGGHYPELRFHEDNVNGQCLRCNSHLHGNLIEYRKRLLLKIGQERLDKLDFIVSLSKKQGFKYDRISLIETILKYSKQKD